MSQVKIIEYESRLKDDLRRLSIEWLEKYVHVEPEDETFMNNPEKYIKKGGFIYFAEFDNKIVGTISLLKISEGIYELAKLGVTEAYQGHKIGYLLMETCLNKAKELKAQKVILYSNHRLTTALKLYQKFGFYDVPVTDAKYLEADVQMEIAF